MPNVEFALHPKQLEAFWTPANEILFGGSAGGGKSFLARVASIIYSMSIPGLQTYFFRRQYADLVTNHLEGPSGFRALLHSSLKDKSVRIVGDEKIIFAHNNSVIFLCHCQHEKDLDAKYRGPEMHFLIIEEATQFSEKMIRFLRGRCRMVGVKVPPTFEGMFPRILYTTNPGGPSHSYFYRNFVIPCDGVVVKQESEEGGMRRLFIRSKLDDNPSMLRDDPEYESRLSGLGPPQLVKALRDGDWTAVEGAFFPELTEKHKLQEFTIPPYWLRFRAFDWGNKSPFAVQWWAVSPGEHISQRDNKGVEYAKYIPRGALVLYREWYGRDHRSRVIELDNDRIASGIIDRSGGESYAFSVADASIFSKFGGPSIAEQFARAGVIFKASSKNRQGGLSEIRRRLVGSDGMPMLYATDNCHWWWETMPTIQVDDNDPEDCDTDGEDHHVDATYYACMARPYVTDKYVEQKLSYTGIENISIRDYLKLAKKND